MTYIANFASVILEPGTPATPVAQESTLPIQDLTGCVSTETATSMSLSAKNMTLTIDRNTKSTDNP